MSDTPKDEALPQRLLTVEEAAAYLHVDTKTVYRLITEAELKAALVGRVYRIDRSDLEQFVRNSKLRVQRARKKTY